MRSANFETSIFRLAFASCLMLAIALVVVMVSAAEPAARQKLAANPSPVVRPTARAKDAEAGQRAADSQTLLVERRRGRLAELPPVADPPSGETAAHPIDAFIEASWSDFSEDERPARLCDDATFARRVYLDLIGVIPSLAELNHFLVDSSAGKRLKLIDQLLDRKADYAAHWAPFWEDILASQNVAAQGGIPTHGNYRQWILESCQENKPYDVMVAELIDPTMPGRRPAQVEELFGTKYRIEYVRNENHVVTLLTAANVGQVFLSTSMKCAGCHDHFENSEWTQARFLGFAGLFADHDLERIRCDVHTGQTVPARFPFELPGAVSAVPNRLDARLHWVAQQITDPANPRFSISIVNRLWKRYLGLGMFEPADDYRPEWPVSQPQLLEWLARDFLEHGCDLKHTIRLIVTSRTYQRAYEPKFADAFDPASPGATRYFRSPALRRLTAEQVLDSVRVATQGQITAKERTFLDAQSTALSQALGRPASRNEIITARPDDVAVVQALELLNGQELQQRIDDAALLARPLRKQDLKKLTDRLYRTVLSRPADSEEKRLGQTFLSAGNLNERVEDVLWSLIVSPEFQFIK